MGKKNTIEFMKIRRYVIDLMGTSGDQIQKIPTSRKLGDMFGVTHPTALRAIQSLTEDGFLIPCRGGGSVTNPSKMNMSQRKMKIFAVLFENGKAVFDLYYHHYILSVLMRELTRRSAEYCTQMIFLNSFSDLESSLKEHPFAGLLAVGVGNPVLCDQMERIRRKGLPVAAFLTEVPKVPSVFWDPAEYHRLALKTLIGKGRRRILIASIPDDIYREAVEKVVRSCRSEFSLPEDSIQVLAYGQDGNAAAMERLLREGVPVDGVIGCRNFHALYHLRDRFPELKDRCIYINNQTSIFDDMNYTGYAIVSDYEEGAARLLDSFLREGSDGENVPVLHETFAMKTICYKDGKYKKLSERKKT